LAAVAAVEQDSKIQTASMEPGQSKSFTLEDGSAIFRAFFVAVSAADAAAQAGAACGWDGRFPTRFAGSDSEKRETIAAGRTSVTLAMEKLDLDGTWVGLDLSSVAGAESVVPLDPVSARPLKHPCTNEEMVFSVSDGKAGFLYPLVRSGDVQLRLSAGGVTGVVTVALSREETGNNFVAVSRNGDNFTSTKLGGTGEALVDFDGDGVSNAIEIREGGNPLRSYAFNESLTGRVALGTLHSCSIDSGGEVKCWGRNVDGRLGNGTSTDSPFPVSVSLPAAATRVTAATYTSCAVVSGGAVYCWGANNDGQLGNGSNNAASTPVAVSGIASGATDVDAGISHTCAVVSSQVKCWGVGTTGELGNGASTSSTTPVTVSGITAATQVSVGGSHACALVSQGGGVNAIYCWGYNGDGELGNGTFSDSPVPVAVTGLAANPIYVSAGLTHTCALLANKRVQCWGDNAEGQLSTTMGAGVTSNVPIYVRSSASSDPLENVVSISAGGVHSCAVTIGGTVKCWGSNAHKQFDTDNSTNPNSILPVGINSLWAAARNTLPAGTIAADYPQDLAAGALQVFAGEWHTCAIRQSGAVACFGENSNGQLGTGVSGATAVPGNVTDGTNVLKVDAD
jgi:alpha-tubulin suppressor-like RCC1 family protein